MNNLFKGWKDVYAFTFQQAIKVKSFKTATVLIGVLLLLAGICSNVLPALFSDSHDSDSASYIETVYVKNSSDLASLTFDGFTEFAGEEYKDMVFKTTSDSIKNLKKEIEGEESHDVILEIQSKEEGYEVEIHLPTVSVLTPNDCNDFLNKSIAYFQQQMIAATGISSDALAFASLPVNHTSFFHGEEDESMGQFLLQLITPMVFSLVLYIMILLYGQSIAKSIISEKSSKLMETILTTIRPYALIAGKVLAMFTVAIMQFLIWVGLGVAGFFAGDLIAGNLVDGYTNSLLETLHFMQENGIFAFSLPAIILSILTIVLAFLFYCSLAGAVSSTLSNSENLSQGMAMFQLPVVFSFLITYLLPLNGGTPQLLNIFRFIPFTAAFMLPSDILLGNISLGFSFAAMGVLLTTTLIMMLLTGKIYKDKIFYRGKNKLSNGLFFGNLLGKK